MVYFDKIDDSKLLLIKQVNQKSVLFATIIFLDKGLI